MEKFRMVSALDLVPGSQHCAEYEPGTCWRQYLMQHHVTTLDSLSSAFKTQKPVFHSSPYGYSRTLDGKTLPHILEANPLLPLAIMPPKSLHKPQFW